MIWMKANANTLQFMNYETEKDTSTTFTSKLLKIFKKLKDQNQNLTNLLAEHMYLNSQCKIEMWKH